MAERKVPNNYYVLLVGDGDDPEVFEPAVCLTDISFQVTNNDISSDTKCGTTHIPGTQNTTVDFSGVTLIDPTAGKVSTQDIFTIVKNKTVFNFKYGPAAPITGDPVYAGRGFITSFTKSDPTNADSTFEGTIQVDENGLTQTITT